MTEFSAKNRNEFIGPRCSDINILERYNIYLYLPTAHNIFFFGMFVLRLFCNYSYRTQNGSLRATCSNLYAWKRRF